ncbi:Uncharacterized protein ALO79_06616 [Pseudomonas syringae pv. castaneae]|uniref:Uncharacterized protein n=1 Tax=Pseudomonas syringae pv. castaneae TaxID=264450 RepID=A0A0P9QJN4_PSESX|nr:Uncharacterized protein ALO79_06616 [Pseudomonas syringae pv. castaneae]
MHRNTDGAGLVGNRASDRLTDPPGGIGRELVATTVFELVHSLHQADVAFLDQIEELQTTVGVLLGDGDHQTQVRFNHLFLRAAGLGLTDRHATVDVLDLGYFQAGFFFQCRQLLLATLDVSLQTTNGFGVFALALGQCVSPAFVNFVARELAKEVGARHTCITYTQLHDGAFLSTKTLKSTPHTLYQTFKLLWNQFDRHEQFGKCNHFGNGVLVVATEFLQRLAGDFHLIGNRTEALLGDDRIGTAFDFVFVVAGVCRFFLVVIGAFGLDGFGIDRRRYFGRRRNAVVRVDIAAQNIGEATAFTGDTCVFGKNMVNRAREVRNCAHHFTDAFFDTFGDFDFAFTGQKFNGTHFTHVHTNGIGGTPDVGLDRCQRCSRFFCGCLVGIGVGQHQGVRIRSTLVYRDPHVVDHADDVFHLLGI